MTAAEGSSRFAALATERLFASVNSHEAFICLCDAAVLLRKSLGLTLRLRPVARLEDLKRHFTAGAANLVVTDAISQLEPAADTRLTAAPRGGPSPEAERWSALGVPVLALLVTGDPLGEAHLYAEAEYWPVFAAGGEHAAQLALRLAEKLVPDFPARFLDALPERFLADQRLRIAGATMRAAENGEWPDPTLLQRWEREGIADAPRILTGARLWWTYRRSEERRESLERSALSCFPSLAAFASACLELTGEEPRAVLDRGGTAFLTARLAWRWASDIQVQAVRQAAFGGSGAVGPPSLPQRDDRGNPAFTAFYHRYQAAVRRGAVERGASPDEAEDIVQEVMFEAYRRGSEWWASKHSQRYFRQRGRWYANALRRRHAGRSYPLHELSSATSPARSPAMEAEARALGVQIAEEVVLLPEPSRSVLRLCVLGEWRSRAAAELLGTTENAVNIHRHRALKILRDRLNDWR